MPFDNGFTSLSSLRETLTSAFQACFAGPIAIRCMQTGLEMVHEPPALFQHSIDKFKRRAARLLACRNECLLFIRKLSQYHPTHSMAIAEHEEITQLLGNLGFANFRLVTIMRSPVDSSLENTESGIFCFNSPPDFPGEEDWKGNRAEWDRFFQTVWQ